MQQMSTPGGKKYDLAIMNPPYDRNLHLKILEKVIPVADETINISPIRWLQDPLAKYKKNSDYNKFKESIAKKIEDVKVLTQNETDNMFGIQMNTQIGVIKCSSKGGFDVSSLVNNKFVSLYEKVMKKTSKIKCVSYKDSKKDTFVPVCLLAGHTSVENGFVWGISFARDRYKYFVHNKCQCERFPNQTPQECKSYNLKTFDTVPVVEFNTKEEAKNFYDYITTDCFIYFVCSHTQDGHIYPDRLPFVEDYTQPWDNKRFCDYFNITGYISDTEAEPGSEWEEILSSMSKYK